VRAKLVDCRDVEDVLVAVLIVRNGQAHSVEMGRSRYSRALSCDNVDILYQAVKKIQDQAGK